MGSTRVVAPSSHMFEAAFRLESLRSATESNALAAVHAPPRPARSARGLVRSVVARGYRLIVPAARPVFTRWRQYNSSVLLAEMSLLRQELRALQVQGIERSRPAELARARAPRARPAVREGAAAQWTLDDERMPHFNAAIELMDSRSGGSLAVTGDPAQLALAVRELGSWLDRATLSAGFGPLTVAVNVTESERDDRP